MADKTRPATRAVILNPATGRRVDGPDLRDANAARSWAVGYLRPGGGPEPGTVVIVGDRVYTAIGPGALSLLGRLDH